MIVVDTPGLNDPNELREKITTEWVKNSNAVIYLIYVASPVHEQDVDFIDRHLIVVPPEKIIFGVTKIDTSQSPGDVTTYIETTLRTTPRLKERHLLDSNRKVYPISTMAAIIKRKRQLSIELTSAEQLQEDRIGGDLIGCGGYLDEFSNAISTQIMSDKGKSLIDSHARKIHEICELKIKLVNLDIAKDRQQMENVELSIADIIKKTKEIDIARQKIDKMKVQFGKKGISALAELESSVTARVESILESAEKDFRDWLYGDLSVERAIRISGFALRTFVSKAIKRERDAFYEADLFQQIEESQEDFKRGLLEVTRGLIEHSTIDIVERPRINLKRMIELADTIPTDLSPEELEDCRERIWKILWTDKETTRAKVELMALGILPDLKRRLRDQAIGAVSAEVDKYFSDLGEQVSSILREYMDQLKDTNKEKMSRDQAKRECEQKIRTKQDLVREFEGKKREIVSSLEKMNG